MTTQYKFTSDGKKVVVIGQLNNVESIVQEIFVTASGDEIPSGEKFTAKSLHDEPVESYQVKQAKAAEEKIKLLNAKKDSVESEIRHEQKRLYQIQAMAKAAISNVNALEELTAEKADRLAKNLSLSWQYGVKVGGVTIKTFEEIIDNGDRNHDRHCMRSMVIYSSRQDKVGVCIGQYSDESGSNHPFDLFMTKEEAETKAYENAKAIWSEHSDGNLYYTTNLIDEMARQGMVIPEEWIEKVLLRSEEEIRSGYAKRREEILMNETSAHKKLDVYRELLVKA